MFFAGIGKRCGHGKQPCWTSAHPLASQEGGTHDGKPSLPAEGATINRRLGVFSRERASSLSPVRAPDIAKALAQARRNAEQPKSESGSACPPFVQTRVTNAIGRGDIAQFGKKSPGQLPSPPYGLAVLDKDRGVPQWKSGHQLDPESFHSSCLTPLVGTCQRSASRRVRASARARSRFCLFLRKLGDARQA